MDNVGMPPPSGGDGSGMTDFLTFMPGMTEDGGQKAIVPKKEGQPGQKPAVDNLGSVTAGNLSDKTSLTEEELAMLNTEGLQNEFDKLTGDKAKKTSETTQGATLKGSGQESKSAVDQGSLQADSVESILDNLAILNTKMGEQQSKIIAQLKSDRPVLDAPDQTDLPGGPDGTANPWFDPNPLVAYLDNYMEMLTMLKEVKVAELRLEINSMVMVMDLAKNAANLIMASAEKEAMMHFLLAATAAIQIGVTAGTMVKTQMAHGSAKSEFEASIAAKEKSIQDHKIASNDLSKPAGGAPPEQGSRAWHKQQQTEGETELMQMQGNKISTINNLTQQKMLHATAIRDITQSATQMADNIIQGVMKVQKAEYDALLKIVEGYSTLMTKEMNSSSEAFRTSQEQIDRLLQSLQSMTDALFRAFSFSKTAS